MTRGVRTVLLCGRQHAAACCLSYMTRCSSATTVLVVITSLASPCAASDFDWRYFAAGGFSAALSHGYTTPLDVVKTRMQTHPQLGTSVTAATRKLVKEEGVEVLLKGLAPTCAGYGVEGALKFGVYEVLKPLFAQMSPNKMLNMLAASVVAGAVASVVLCPAEEVRIVQVSNPDYCDGGTVATLRKLAREKGALASFEGMPAMCAKQVPYTMGKQVSFDVCCACVRGLFDWGCHVSKAESLRPALDRLVPCVAALPAAVLACLMSHPGDMVLTAYYNGGGGSVVAAVRKLVAEGGMPALFRGLRARLLHVISIIWVQLVVYDKVKQVLGLPATGH